MGKLGDAEAQAVISAWIATEALSPREVRSWKQLAQQIEGQIVGDPPRPDTKRGDSSQAYLVILGGISVAASFAEINRHLPIAAPSPEESADGRGLAIAAALLLDGYGRYIPKSLRVASFAWALGRLPDSLHPATLTSWREAHREIRHGLEAEYLRNGRRAETRKSLLALSLATRDALAIPPGLWNPLPTIIRAPKRSACEFRHLSSPLLDDLLQLTSQVPPASWVSLARTYLGGRGRIPSWDPLLHDGRRNALLAAAAYPEGAWPCLPGQEVTTLQQLAVNAASSDLVGGMALAISGPPASGKAYVIRQSVAAILTRRAAYLSTVLDPAAAVDQHLSGGSRLSILEHAVLIVGHSHETHEGLAADLCGLEGLGDQAATWPRYFPEIADQAFAVAGTPSEGACWGLLAAKLGNASRRRQFVREVIGRLDEALKNFEGDPASALERWHQARDAYRTAWDVYLAQKALVEALPKAAALAAAAGRDAVGFGSLRERLERVSSARVRTAAQAAIRMQDAEQVCVATEVALARLEASQPWWLWRLLRTRRFSEHAASLVQAPTARTEAKAELARAVMASRKAALAVERLRVIDAALDARLGPGALAANEAQRQFDEATRAAGSQVVVQTGGALDREAIMATPLAGGGYQAAREALFRAGLVVQRAFVEAAASPLRRGLVESIAILRGREVSEEKAGRLWGLLFTVVPVVTTSLASVGRLFTGLRGGAIGWLVVDDANQAKPQAALGALWRAGRAVVLGDPLQIGPISPIPVQTTRGICAAVGVAHDDWMAPTQSVLSLAGRISMLRSPGPRGDPGGTPLLVQYRMDDKVATIAKLLTRGGQFFSAACQEPSPIRACLGDSAWINIEGTEPGLWSPGEGEAALRAMLALEMAGLHHPDCIIASPFGETVTRLRRVLAANPMVLASLSRAGREAWLRDRIGTVHTIQAKSAEAVILVLGAGPGTRPDLRRWAGDTPNLLHSAITRARSAFYIVGNRSLWQAAPAFAAAAGALVAVPSEPWLPGTGKEASPL